MSVPNANITQNTTDDTGLTNTIYRYVGGFIILRTAADMAQERTSVLRNTLLQVLFDAQARISTLEQIRLRYPNSAAIIAQAAAANARLVSVAQSIGITTATTQ